MHNSVAICSDPADEYVNPATSACVGVTPQCTTLPSVKYAATWLALHANSTTLLNPEGGIGMPWGASP